MQTHHCRHRDQHRSLTIENVFDFAKSGETNMFQLNRGNRVQWFPYQNVLSDFKSISNFDFEFETRT